MFRVNINYRKDNKIIKKIEYQYLLKIELAIDLLFDK